MFKKGETLNFHALPYSGLRDREFWLCILLLKVGKANLELRVWTCKSAEVAHAKSVNRKCLWWRISEEKVCWGRKWRRDKDVERCLTHFRGVVLIRAMLQRGEHRAKAVSSIWWSGGYQGCSRKKIMLG